MAKNRKFEPGDRAVFMFSFHEHDDDGLDEASTEQEIVQMIASWDWEFQRTAKPGANYISDPDGGDPATIEELSALVHNEVGEGSGIPEGALQIPFDKLKVLLERDGWRFVCGSYTEFEGNHNDTEIEALLEKL